MKKNISIQAQEVIGRQKVLQAKKPWVTTLRDVTKDGGKKKSKTHEHGRGQEGIQEAK